MSSAVTLWFFIVVLGHAAGVASAEHQRQCYGFFDERLGSALTQTTDWKGGLGMRFCGCSPASFELPNSTRAVDAAARTLTRSRTGELARALKPSGHLSSK